MENNHSGQIVSLNVSLKKGTIKTPRDQITITERGIDEDAHAGFWHRQVSILAQESIERFATESDRGFMPGEFAENITTKGLNLAKVAVLDRFHIGDVELEVTQLGKRCHGDGCAIFREVGKCVMPKEGIFCRVIKPGRIKTGDSIRYQKNTLLFKIITLSTRASLGEYEDKSGPVIKDIISTFFRDKPWHIAFDMTLIGDDKEKLRCEIIKAIDKNCAFIFTTGGTGIARTDITPDVVEPMLQRKIPGLMEYIRTKYGAKIPSALLSRSVAGLIDDTFIYTLPGSVNAVKEYTEEILKTLVHSIYMLHGIDSH